MANPTYFVHVEARSNDIEALDKIYDGIYDLDYTLDLAGRPKTPEWYENIGEDEAKAVTEEERDEFWNHYGGLKSEGYAHLVFYEGVVTERGKDKFLEILNIGEKSLDVDDCGYEAYRGIREAVKLNITLHKCDG